MFVLLSKASEKKNYVLANKDTRALSIKYFFKVEINRI
jgi:hypothetical protein